MRNLALLIIALAGPALHVAGVLTKGVGLLQLGTPRLAVLYGGLALSAALAAYLVFRRGAFMVRALAALALLANLASIGYVTNAWSRQMRRALGDLKVTQVEAGKVGLVVCAMPAPDAKSDPSKALEAALDELVHKAELESYIDVRPGPLIESGDRAQQLGRDMRANVVVWAENGPTDMATATRNYYVTVLGANEVAIALDPAKLMLLMSTQQTFGLHGVPYAEADRASRIITPVAAGFGFLAVGQPALAAGQFEAVRRSPDTPDHLGPVLQSYLGIALLFAERPDLAAPAFQGSDETQPNSAARVGLGLVALRNNDWRAAEVAFNRALAINPYDPAAYCGQGLVFASQRNVSRAVSAYRQAITLSGSGSVPYALLGMAYELVADVDGARDAYRRAAMGAGPNAGLHVAVLARSDHIARNPPTAVPTATPVPLPTETPIPEWALYRVEKGDTLSSIALKLDVDMQVLIELNKIRDPSALSVGAALRLPARDP
ncbi:MAG: tetratricopeptide repeat protein [Chloroflexota bacterium]